MKKNNLIPVSGSQNMVLIERLPDEEKRPSGLVLLGKTVKPQYKAKVLSVSTVDNNGRKPTVKEDDTIVYSKHAGIQVDIGEGDNTGFLREFDILLIIK